MSLSVRQVAPPILGHSEQISLLRRVARGLRPAVPQAFRVPQKWEAFIASKMPPELREVAARPSITHASTALRRAEVVLTRSCRLALIDMPGTSRKSMSASWRTMMTIPTMTYEKEPMALSAVVNVQVMGDSGASIFPGSMGHHRPVILVPVAGS